MSQSTPDPLHRLPKSRIAAILWLVTAAYWVAIFIATHVPMQSNWTLAKLSNRFDKVEHVASFAGLSLLLCVTGTMLDKRSALVASVLGVIVLYAGFDEATQYFIPTRHADWLDWIADLLGGGIGVTTFLLIGEPLLMVTGWRAEGA